MPVRIIFRLGDVIPSSEVLDVGTPIWNPTKNQLGIGSGNSQPSWLPGIDSVNQDMILYGSSLIRSDVGGSAARFGWDGSGQFSMYTFSGLRLRITDSATTFYNRVTLNAGGTLSGNMDTTGGRFTALNAQALITSTSANTIALQSGLDGSYIGQIDSQGVTSLSQQQIAMALASMQESTASLFRNMFSSGIVAARQFNSTRPFDIRYKFNMGDIAALNIHNHSSYRGMCGLGELSVLMNGYHVQTRHNDYRLMVPQPSLDVFGLRTLNTGPAVPAACSALPSGYTGLVPNGNLTGTQIAWMQSVYANNPQYCIYELSYLEMWIQPFDTNIEDIASSAPFAGNTAAWQQILQDINAYTASGFKDPAESLAQLPGLILTNDVNGHPVLGYVNWRISSIPVANMSNSDATITMEDGTEWDTRGLPFNVTKAASGIIDSTNRFRIRRSLYQKFLSTNGFGGVGRQGVVGQYGGDSSADTLEDATYRQWSDLMTLNTTMFDCVDLEELCMACPGFDGQGTYNVQYIKDQTNAEIPGFLNEQFIYSSTNYRGMSYYSNSFVSNNKDPSGFNTKLRGFNDTNLFTAYTSQPNIIGGFTFMIPLELVVRTPRENWNPLLAPAVATPTGDGTYTRPYSGVNDNGVFYTIPADSLTISHPLGTAADTNNSAYVQTPSGVKQMLGSGINIFDYDGQRRRFPLAPDASQFTASGQNMEWLKFTLKGLLKQIASGTITGDEIDAAF